MRYGINLIKIWTLKLQTPLGYAKGSLKNGADASEQYSIPTGVKEEVYCKKSGLLAGEQCQETGIGYYRKEDCPKVCGECK